MSGGQCRACRADVAWCKSMSTGKPIPLDLSPDPDYGTVRKHFSGTTNQPVVYAEVLKGDALNAARADGERLWMRHRDTCIARKPANPKPDHVQLELPVRSHR